MLNINGIDLEFDLFDADFAEKYQKAMDKVQNKEKSFKDTGNLAKTIRFECNLIFDFFNELFGEGTDKKIFGEKTNIRECQKAFKDVIEYSYKQAQELANDMADFSVERAERK